MVRMEAYAPQLGLNCISRIPNLILLVHLTTSSNILSVLTLFVMQDWQETVRTRRPAGYPIRHLCVTHGEGIFDITVSRTTQRRQGASSVHFLPLHFVQTLKVGVLFFVGYSGIRHYFDAATSLPTLQLCTLAVFSFERDRRITLWSYGACSTHTQSAEWDGIVERGGEGR